MSGTVVRINVTQDVRANFLNQFAAQSDFKTRKSFAAHIVQRGLEKLNKNSNPPGEAPRDIPTANGGNRPIEFDRDQNKELVMKLERFREKHKYLSQPVANRACLFAGLDVAQPWS